MIGWDTSKQPAETEGRCTRRLSRGDGMQSGKYSQQLLAEIKSLLRFLFDQYSFVPTVCSEARQGEYCLVVLRSEQCQIKFRQERGTPEYFFGTLSASPDWENTGEWYDGESIVAYLLKEKSKVNVQWPQKKQPWSTEDILRMFAARLEPVAGDIISAASDLKVDWWGPFQLDLKERIEKIKAQIARGEKVKLS